MPLLTDEERKKRDREEREDKRVRAVARSMFYTLAAAFFSSAVLGVYSLARLVF